MVWHKAFNRCSHGNSFISDTQLKPPVFRQFYKHQTVHFAKLQLRDLRGTIPSMQPLLCPPKCALNFVQTAFRDLHDLNNLIQESFTRTQCLLRETLPSTCVLKQRCGCYVYSDIHFSKRHGRYSHYSKSRFNCLSTLWLPSGSYVTWCFPWIERLHWQRFEFDLNTAVMQQALIFQNVTPKLIRAHLRKTTTCIGCLLQDDTHIVI